MCFPMILQHYNVRIPQSIEIAKQLRDKLVAQLLLKNPCDALHHSKWQILKQLRDHNYAHLEGDNMSSFW